MSTIILSYCINLQIFRYIHLKHKVYVEIDYII